MGYDPSFKDKSYRLTHFAGETYVNKFLVKSSLFIVFGIEKSNVSELTHKVNPHPVRVGWGRKDRVRKSGFPARNSIRKLGRVASLRPSSPERSRKPRELTYIEF